MVQMIIFMAVIVGFGFFCVLFPDAFYKINRAANAPPAPRGMVITMRVVGVALMALGGLCLVLAILATIWTF